MTLDELVVGKSATIVSVGGNGALRNHFLDMGLTPNTQVSLIKTAPMGDPIELRLRGYELTLRLHDAAKIEIKDVTDTKHINDRKERIKDIPHPQVGEMGIYHVRKKGDEVLMIVKKELKIYLIHKLVKWEFIMYVKKVMNCVLVTL